ncbi:UvrD-helicase domain-containing protein [Janibacter anophelis]|uniref:UvrD-helicase domain-containing protein n=1 Tax=Janibacter anophelis TaxID=319054 RepID=UPI000DEED85C|nr:UvrD-helicase domain-containing protein [Janibacter anophelis]
MSEYEDLPFEKVTNRAYLEGLDRFRSQRIDIGTARSRTWLDETPTNGAAKVRPGCLAGRVALNIDDPDLGREFYVGVRYLSGAYFSHPVVGWDAPVAKIFFDPESAEHELLEHVRVRRTLSSRGRDIVRLDDEWEGTPPGQEKPFANRQLQVAEPPSPAPGVRSRRAPARRSSAVTDPPTPSVTGPAPTRTQPEAPKAHSAATEVAGKQPPDELHRGMRAVSSVEHALAAPRESALTSVLSTLQPDQYRLVTRSGDRPLVVQGHPGTGKTIIAIHRAAYLVSSERERSGDTAVSRLLFLGPTNAWANHVEKAVGSLAEKDIAIASVPLLLARIIGSQNKLHGLLDYGVDEVDAGLFGLAQAVARIVSTTEGWATGKGARQANLATVYSAVRYGSMISKVEIGIPTELRSFTRSLPSFGTALSQRTLQPLMAAIAIAVDGAPRKFDHIIVDEAQDVSPLTWEIIKAHMSGGITIVGDMNQRRNDVGHSSWQRVVEQLDLMDGDQPVEPEVITRGYRSTQAILNFAKALLPAAQRDVKSLQTEGVQPVVRRAGSPKTRDAMIEEEAIRLCKAYPTGQVAIIVLVDQLKDLEAYMLKQGWRSARHHVWSKDGLRTKIVTPTTARGVEFDAVVVVEPGDFPRNLGRVGQLYTSLTRANRELAVVHHKALPDELRRHSRQR